MRQIREWLEKKGSYAAGLALYETHGKSRVVLNSLRHGESEFTRATLRRELEKILASDVTTTATAPVTTAPRVHLVDTSAERVHETPKPVHVGPASSSTEPVKTDELVAKQRSAWFAERARLHAQLELVATDAERHTMGERILVVSELLTASYQAAPPPAAPRPDLSALVDQGEMRRLLANLRPQASKLKKNPARAADLQQVLADITLLESLLISKS